MAELTQTTCALLRLAKRIILHQRICTEESCGIEGRKKYESVAEGTKWIASELSVALTECLHRVDDSYVMDTVLDLLVEIAIKTGPQLLHGSLEANRRGIFTIFAITHSDCQTWDSDEQTESRISSLLSPDIRAASSEILRRLVEERKCSSIPGPSMHFHSGLPRHTLVFLHLKGNLILTDASCFVFHVLKYINDLAESYQAPVNPWPVFGRG